jgi:hypothetical protein
VVRAEVPRQLPRFRRHLAGEKIELRRVSDMGDDRVAGRALLGREDAAQCRRVHRAGTESVHGFRGEGHEPAGAQHACRPRDRGGVRRCPGRS